MVPLWTRPAHNRLGDRIQEPIKYLVNAAALDNVNAGFRVRVYICTQIARLDCSELNSTFARRVGRYTYTAQLRDTSNIILLGRVERARLTLLRTPLILYVQHGYSYYVLA